MSSQPPGSGWGPPPGGSPPSAPTATPTQTPDSGWGTPAQSWSTDGEAAPAAPADPWAASAQPPGAPPAGAPGQPWGQPPGAPPQGAWGQPPQGAPPWPNQQPPPPTDLIPAKPDANPVVAALLSFFFPGAGQLMLGQTTKGAIILAGAVFTCCLSGVFNVIAAIDAYQIGTKLKDGKPVREFDVF